jgi:DNA polymerase III alpha subunit
VKTSLADRTLWHDGTNQVNPDSVPELFLMGVPVEKIVVNELNSDIELFNSLADNPIATSKEGNAPFDFKWQIPEQFKQINLEQFLLNELEHRGLGSDQYEVRVHNEMAHIRANEIEPLILTLLYIVTTLKHQGKVWGVGRGSSCASLVLHLIGVHEVDPVKYGIPLTEFFHA